MELDESCKYIMSARMMVMEDKYDKAFEILLMAFDQIPSLIPIYEEEFCSVLLMLNTALADSDYNHVCDIFKNFSKALKIFPNNPFLLNDIGKHLYKYGYYVEALEQFEEVLQLSPTYANVEKNINSVKNFLVERWHYRMLNDNLRNESYKRAIKTIITQNDKVLDVGTGTGLLSLYGREAGASKIIACDGSKVMYNLAKKIIKENKIKKIEVINKMSTDMTIQDMGGRCTKLVTEMFDAGLFGEHVLQMLTHAWPNLLYSNSIVIPSTAEFFVMAAQCNFLSKNYQLGSEAKSLLNIPSLHVHVCTQGESYDSEDVHLIKDIKYLSEPKSLMKVNFNDPRDIVETLNKIKPYEVELVAKEAGLMDIVVGWFNLYLTDTITITTDPRAPDRANAWQQAVFSDPVPKTVEINDSINLKFLMNGGQLTMMPSSDNPIIHVSSEVIRFLNDTDYMKIISDSLFIAYVHLAQIKDISEINIVDLCPFPLFGLLMLKRGAKSLTCCTSYDHDKEFIMKVISENGIHQSKVTVIFGDNWSTEVFEESSYHAIFNHALELCGDVYIGREQAIQSLRQSKLVHGGLFLPQQVKLVAQLVSSHWLDLNNRLYDSNVSNYTLATYLNRYKVSQNYDIDFSTLKYVPLSEPVVLCDCDNENKLEEKHVKIISDGYANAIICWYSIGVINLTQELSTNRPDSFMNGMLFLTYSKEQLIAGSSAKIIRHRDKDGNFKLALRSVQTPLAN